MRALTAALLVVVLASGCSYSDSDRVDELEAQITELQAEMNDKEPNTTPTIEPPSRRPLPTPTPQPRLTWRPSPTPTVNLVETFGFLVTIPLDLPTPTPWPLSLPRFTTSCTTGTAIVNGHCLRSPTIGNSGGPSAICRDGTYSYSQNRSGTCSHHGGVAVWGG